MDINFKDLFKEQILFMLIPIVLLAALLGGAGYFISTLGQSAKDVSDKEANIAKLEQDKANLEQKLKQMSKEEKSPDMKQIFELTGMKFGAEASFAPLFDDMIKIAKASGIRIRSIDYNYAPSGDPIFSAKISGVNACELNTTIVGTYSQIQAFLKTLLSENYLVGISKIEIVSWQRDKSILIANVQLRYYTKTN